MRPPAGMTPEGPMDSVVCVTPSVQRAHECALVLEAINVAHRLIETDAGWAVMVAENDAARARRTLAAYEAENRRTPAAQRPLPEYGRTWIGAVAAALLIAFFAATGGRDQRNVWYERGSASAGHILRGEVWRAVTALTLHADLVHVASNALACVILITAVGWWLGPGLGICLVLLAGAAGNALTAVAYGAHHNAIGASTSTFGALGILAARQFMERRRHPWSRRTAWVAAAAGLALLGMLGTAPGSDILAHFFGLLIWGAVGAGAARTLRRPPRPFVQWTLALIAAFLVAGSWWIALASVPHRSSRSSIEKLWQGLDSHQALSVE